MWKVLLVEPCTPGHAPVVSVNQPAPVFGGACVSRPWSEAFVPCRSSSRKPGVSPSSAYCSTASWRRPSEAKNSSLPLSSPWSWSWPWPPPLACAPTNGTASAPAAATATTAPTSRARFARLHHPYPLIPRLPVRWANHTPAVTPCQLSLSQSTSKRHPGVCAGARSSGSAERGRGREHARARGSRSPSSASAQRALAHHHRGRGVARVALGGDRGDVAAAVDLHPEVAGLGAPSRSGLRRGRGARCRAPCAWARRRGRPPSAPRPAVKPSAPAPGSCSAETSR